jgi:hypothetical protein
LPLAPVSVPRSALTGHALIVQGGTAPKAVVTVDLQVVQVHWVVTGIGIYRKRHVQRRVLYHLVGKGRADGHGRFRVQITINYRVHVPTVARIAVTARLPGRSAVYNARITIVPRSSVRRP